MSAKNFIVKKTRFGKGAFAAKRFRKWETICHMEGKVTGLHVLSEVKKKGRNLLIDPLQIGEGRYIELAEPYIFINHSCSPNVGIKHKNELFALRNIKKGEEIFYDYSTTIDESLDCKCGDKQCRGKIGDFFTLPKIVQKKYIDLGAVPDFIKKKIKR